MMKKQLRFLKYLLPYGVICARNKFFSPKMYKGDFSSWEPAEKKAVGYDSENIIEKVLASTQAVIDGKALFERDSVVFFEEDYNWPLLTGLGAVSAQKSPLHILDFGGALGSVYWQNRKLLNSMSEGVVWHVVEQPAMVEAAKKLKYNAPLFFHNSIEDAYAADEKINAVLFASVLQYLPNWKQIIQTVQSHNPEYILVDRTPVFADFPGCRCSIQIVPPAIYDANYVSWIFGREEIPKALEKQYNCLYNYISPISGSTYYVDGKVIDFKGYCFKKN